MPAQTPSRPIGAHVPVTGGLADGGLRYAAEIGAEAIQVFVSNPRGWAPSAGDARQDAALRDHVASTGLPVFVHATYLINLGSPDPVTAAAIGGVAAHTRCAADARSARGAWSSTPVGACVRAAEQAMCAVRERLLPLLDRPGDDGPTCCWSRRPGRAHALRHRRRPRPYFEAVDWHPQAGVCLDTCHVFAAGHDLAAPRRRGRPTRWHRSWNAVRRRSRLS